MPAVQRLGKWRVLLTGWQLGTRPKGDPEGDAVRDLNEARLMLRVEVTALVSLLTSKGAFTLDEFADQVEAEADLLCMAYEAKFPGVRAVDHGLEIDPLRALPWMKGWKP